MNHTHMPKRINKSRYNVSLSYFHRQILEKIAKIEKRPFSNIIEFALEKLNSDYYGGEN